MTIDLEPERAAPRNLVDGRDAAVDGEHEPVALLGQPRERLAASAVAFLEAAGQVPADVGAEIAEAEHRERGGADTVDVVVAVDADPRARADRGRGSIGRLRRLSPSAASVMRGDAPSRNAAPRPRRRSRGARGRVPSSR